MGSGHKLDLPEDNFRGPGQKARDFVPAWGKSAIGMGNVTPFSGRAQRLPEEHGLRAAAISRMRELHEHAMQTQRRHDALDHRQDMARRQRRGGQPGDVVPLGKRKRDDAGPGFNPRPRLGARPTGAQQFNIGT